MSSEVSQHNSVFRKFQTRPKLNKHKARDFLQKEWEISSTDFHEKQLEKKKSPTFVLNNEDAVAKQKNNESFQKNFFGNVRNSIKRKSVLEVTNIAKDFSHFDEKSASCSILPTNYLFLSREDQHNIFPKKRKCFDVPDYQASFLENKSCSKLTLRGSNDFKNVFDKRHQLFEKEPRKKKPLCELSFNQKSFDSDFVKKVPVRDISVNYCSDMKEPILFSATENLTNISDTKVEMPQRKIAELFEKEPRRNKPLCELSFNQKSFVSDFVKKAPVSDISVNYCNNTKESVLFTATENLTNISNSEIEMPQQEVAHESSQIGSNLQCSKKQNLFESLNLSKIASSNASLSVGSNWVQSLQWPAQENSHLDEKKKVHSIIPGGYSDQMLKLQRRELSEKAFYDHKIGVKKNMDSLAMTIISVLPLDEIVVAKCFMSPSSSEEVLNFETEFRKDLKNFYCKDSTAVDINGKEEDHCFAESLCLVLFRKHLFCKQQMKSGRSFLLLQPWNYFLLKSLHYPVIFCAHFKNITTDLPLCDDIENKRCTRLRRYHDARKCNMGLKNNNIDASQNYKEIDMFYYKWKTSLHLSARIQRIWKQGLLLENSLDFPSNQNCRRLSLLLQSKDGIFFELVVPCLSDASLVDWFKCIWKGEGKCYTFYNLKVAHRLQRKRCPKLFKYLQTLLKQNTVGELNQDFIYQLVIDKVSKVRCEITEPSFPVPLPVCIKPLVYLQRDFSDNERFSCAVKILFQYKEFLYISDESILNSATIQYVRVVLSKEESFLFGSEIIIKEAVIQEGNLLLDQYSQVSTLQEKDDKLAVVRLEDFKMPLNINSRLSDLVVVTGEIISIDDNEAYTWLQCSFCLKENLVQDTKGTIYCEDCSAVVEKPVLNVKMSVTIILQEESNILLKIELLSCTIKKILSLDENSYHPHCNVSDVLGKQVGPLLCYVRGDEMVSCKKVFYLTEINRD